MVIIWYKNKTGLGSKRDTMKKQRELKERGYHTKLVKEEKYGKPTKWGVEYS
jgi:hypothetical protein